MRKWRIVASIRRSDEAAPGYNLDFDRFPITIGASIDNDIVLDGPQVSGRHAHVAMSRGALILHNSSRNGTFVDGQRTETVNLGGDEIISIPPFELQFELRVEGGEEEESGGTEVTDLESLPTESGTVVTRQRTQPALGPKEKSLFMEVVKAPDADVGRRFSVTGDSIRIGRSGEAEILIDCPTLSRLHAEIRRIGGDWLVKDLNSANGTFLNGSRVRQSRLRPGDELILGEDIVIHVLHEEVAAAQPATTVLRRPPPRTSPRPADLTPAGERDMDPTRRTRGVSLHELPTLLDNTPVPPLPEPPEHTPPPRPTPSPVLTPPGQTKPGGVSTQSRSLVLKSSRAVWNSKVLIVSIGGWVDAYNYTELGTAMDRVVDAGERLVMLDVAKLAYIDHTGLGVIMKSITAVERYGGTIRLVGATQRLLDAISLSRLDAFLKGKLLADDRAAQREFAKA